MLAPYFFIYHKLVPILHFCSMWFLYVVAMSVLVISTANAATNMRISNLSNITIPQWVTGDPAITQDVFVCIYRGNEGNNSRRTYKIRATGDGPGFLLKSGANTIAYTVTWNDGGVANPGGGTTATMSNNIVLENRQNARNQLDSPANSSDCNAGASPTARLRIGITAAVMDAARDGTFTGTLTLLLSPA